MDWEEKEPDDDESIWKPERMEPREAPSQTNAEKDSSCPEEAQAAPTPSRDSLTCYTKLRRSNRVS